MDGFMTTYRQDFIWPFIRTFPMRATDKLGKEEPKKMLGPLDANKPWVRYGPNPPLLDPRIYPGTIGKSPGQMTFPKGPTDKISIEAFLHSKEPKTDGCACWRGQDELALPKDCYPDVIDIPPVSTINEQPSQLLKTLKERYPYLYNVLKTIPPDELIARLMADRFNTTYMMDYGKQGMHPSDHYDHLMAATGLCAPTITKILPGSTYRPKIRDKKHSTEGLVTKKSFEKETVTIESEKVKLLPWKSEYSDSISKLGEIIISEDLHTKRKKR